MKEEKIKKEQSASGGKISDVFFSRADKVWDNTRLFLRFKKFARIKKEEKESERDFSGTKEMKQGKEKEMAFVPLSEIAKNSAYSKNYINFSARQGKLKAKESGGVWQTAEEVR